MRSGLLLDRTRRLVSTDWVSQIHLRIGGEKGGVGKSVVARLLAQYWVTTGSWTVVRRCRRRRASARRARSLLRRFPSQFVDLSSNQDSADQILDRALRQRTGASLRRLARCKVCARSPDAWLTGANVLALARELGAPITFWHVT